MSKTKEEEALKKIADGLKEDEAMLCILIKDSEDEDMYEAGVVVKTSSQKGESRLVKTLSELIQDDRVGYILNKALLRCILS